VGRRPAGSGRAQAVQDLFRPFCAAHQDEAGHEDVENRVDGGDALSAVVRASDGRGPATRLTEAVIAHFGLEHVSGLPRIVYDLELPRMSVAALGPVVQHARDTGDAVATGILARAADELTLAAGSVATRLRMRDDAFRFVLAGGVFRAVPWLADELGHRLNSSRPEARCRCSIASRRLAQCAWRSQPRGESSACRSMETSSGDVQPNA
jgi:N-acetylglucosamine kinase-like BadF-type ATPase